MGGLFEWLRGTYTCECGAVYKVAVTQTAALDTDDMFCEHCGRIIERRRDSAALLSYYLVSRPR